MNILAPSLIYFSIFIFELEIMYFYGLNEKYNIKKLDR